MKRKATVKDKLITVLLVLVFVIGLSLLLYPTVSNYWNLMHSSRVVANYDSMISALSKADYQEMIDAARAYNQSLLNNPNRFLLTEEGTRAYKQLLSINQSDVMGYVNIPKINVRLPLYHTTDEAVLQVGIGHMEGSSLPIGGESTHAAMSGHTGLPSARLWTDLDQVSIGDKFYIHVAGDLLVYQVDQIKVVEPDDMSLLEIVPGEDHATLVTCTPYGINSHRLLVRGTRIHPVQVEIQSNAREMATWIGVMLIAAPVFLIGLIGLILYWVFKKRK